MGRRCAAGDKDIWQSSHLLAWNERRIFENNLFSFLSKSEYKKRLLLLSSLVPRAWQWQCILAASPLSVIIASFFRRWSAVWMRFDRSRISRINVMSYSAGPANIMLWQGDYVFVSVQQVSNCIANFPLGQNVLSGCGNVSPLHFESNLRSARESPTLPHCSLVWPQLQQFAHRWFVLCPMCLIFAQEQQRVGVKSSSPLRRFRLPTVVGLKGSVELTGVRHCSTTKVKKARNSFC